MLLLLLRSRRSTTQPPPVTPPVSDGFIGITPSRDGGRRRRVRPRELEPVWQAEHENDAALIAVGII